MGDALAFLLTCCRVFATVRRNSTMAHIVGPMIAMKTKSGTGRPMVSQPELNGLKERREGEHIQYGDPMP